MIGCIPYVVQYILVAYFIHRNLYLLIPFPWIVLLPFPLPSDNHWFVLCICESASFFFVFTVSYILYMWYHIVLFFLYMIISLSIIPLSIYVVPKGKMSFIFYGWVVFSFCVCLKHILAIVNNVIWTLGWMNLLELVFLFILDIDWGVEL